MRKHDVALIVPFLAVVLVGPATHAEQSVCGAAAGRGEGPHTPSSTAHLKDDYFWLREKNNPEVIKHLEPRTPTPKR